MKSIFKTVKIPEGYVEYEFDHGINDIFYILRLVVNKEKRNLGFGSILLNEMIDLAKLKKCKCIEIDAVPLENNNSTTQRKLIKFYKKFGFEKVSNIISEKKIGEKLRLAFY
jgi:ribosomal protein S18 acetylase RimI-like enzyme